MDYKIILVIFHLIGTALGLGGATISDFLFFRFLKDLRISKWEESILKFMSHIIWIGIGILVLSGVLLYLNDMEALNESSKFIAKVLVVAIVIINGIVLHVFVSPQLRKITFHKKHKHHPGELRRLRKAAFACGAISVTSWYTTLVLATLPKTLPTPVMALIGIYAGVMVIGIIAALYLENHLHNKS